MRLVTKDIINATRVGYGRLAIYTCVWSALLTLVTNTQINNYLRTTVSWPADFQVRSYLGKNSLLNPKLKVYYVDDSTVAWLKRPYLRISEWSALIGAMNMRRPRTIIIDKIFGVEETISNNEKQEQKAQEALLALKAPVVGAAFVSPVELKFRTPLELSGQSYKLDKLLRVDSKTSLFPSTDLLRLPKAVSNFVYGPYEGIRAAFGGVGHIHYSGDDTLIPYYRVNAKTVLPHIGIFASSTRAFKNGELYLENKIVPTLKDGSVVVNFLKPETLKARAKSLRFDLARAMSNQPLSNIEKGDVVVILPLMYTGNTDFKDTPFGQIPAGFATLSFVNSVLNQDWIRTFEPNVFIIFLACLLGALLARYLDHHWLLLGNIGVNAMVFCAAQYLFSRYNIQIPWLHVMTGVSATSLSGFLYKSRLNATKATILRTTLDGAVAPKELRDLVGGNKTINLEAREHVITIMFIDVAGYSLLAENQVPRVAFDQLKVLINKITEEIHNYGGMVNKTLGDGLLCLFGYNFENEQLSTDHAEKAVACAIKIQEQNIRNNLQAGKRGDPVYPLRIGIHTASVFLGDLGVGERIDFTAVGNGVNFAKRLEQACELHSVLFSGTTKDLIASLGLHSEGLMRKMISIKHHANQIEAFEYDPFFMYQDVRVMALDAYRQCASLARMEQRFVFDTPDVLQIISNVGDAKLINYSGTGLSIKLKSHLVKGSTLVISIDSVDGMLAQMIKAIGVREIKAEVRWAYNETDGTVHGLLYRNVNSEQAKALVDTLRNYDLSLRRSKATSKIA